MTNPDFDMQALAGAFQAFTQTTRTMEESYRRLQERFEQLDRELDEKNRQLAFTSDYLNYILESMSEGVIAVDTHAVITRFNRAATVVLGYSADEVAGRPFRDVFGRDFSVPPGGRHMMELRARDGRMIPVSERDSPISDRNNENIGTVKVFEDLTEVESLRTRVRQKERLAALGEMAATVAHEIRNPLGGIIGFASLLARDIPHDDPRARLVEKILVGSRELGNVVNELLEYTRPVQLRVGPLRCGALLESVLRSVNPDEQRISIVNRVDADLTVIGDPDKLRQVLLNILLNAVQSIETAGRVEISARLDGATATLSVADTGCGIAPELVDRVFSPFFTTKEKGTGLGLAVASKIVEAHGGKLWVESEPGSGAVFHMRLPAME